MQLVVHLLQTFDLLWISSAACCKQRVVFATNNPKSVEFGLEKKVNIPVLDNRVARTRAARRQQQQSDIL